MYCVDLLIVLSSVLMFLCKCSFFVLKMCMFMGSGKLLYDETNIYFCTTKLKTFLYDETKTIHTTKPKMFFTTKRIFLYDETTKSFYTTKPIFFTTKPICFLINDETKNIFFDTTKPSIFLYDETKKVFGFVV